MALVHSQSLGWALGAVRGWGGGAGFYDLRTRSGAGVRPDPEVTEECGVEPGLMLTGPWKGWSVKMNPGYSERDSALSSSERRAPTLESLNSDLGKRIQDFLTK